MNILVLDDEKNLAQLVGMCIENMGHTANVFSEVGPALRYLVKDPVDAAIVDFQIRGDDINGSMIIDFIKKHVNIPCMLMTGSLMIGQKDILNNNWDLLLDKPFNVTIFEREFNELIKKNIKKNTEVKV